ncbi:hypothetical protein [Clostridium sp.]|uniref:hypothetical protein n=1 Tax=Clostridium sp. TaxID=1506 RepID=UPI0025BE1B02|nr:hypothetical protein [Clostridium sp.]
MSKIQSLQRIGQLSKQDIKVLLSFIFPEEWLFSIGDIVSGSGGIDGILEESRLRHEIGPKVSEIINEMYARKEILKE